MGFPSKIGVFLVIQIGTFLNHKLCMVSVFHPKVMTIAEVLAINARNASINTCLDNQHVIRAMAAAKFGMVAKCEYLL